MTTIRAAVSHAFGAPLTVEDIEIRAPEAGEIEVTLDACAICFSDIHAADGAWGGALPAVYGHEAAGRITAIGPGVRGRVLNETVLVTLIRACGACPSCAGGKPVLCDSAFDRPAGPLTTREGGHVVQGIACGAFAEKVVVDQTQIVPIPSDIPMPSAALLSCGVITGLGAVVNTGAIRPGQTVVVIGAGGVGLNAIQGARIAGASRIVAVDMTEAKLDDAMAFGATDGVLATGPAPWDAARKVIPRGADLVVVTVGVPSVFTDAAKYLATGGRVVMVGMPHSGAVAEIDPGTQAALGQGMIGSRMGDTVLARDIPWLVDLYRQGRLKLDELVSKTWPLDEINEAIADTRSGAARRNVIVF